MVNPVTITMVNNIFSVSTFWKWLKVVRRNSSSSYYKSGTINLSDLRFYGIANERVHYPFTWFIF